MILFLTKTVYDIIKVTGCAKIRFIKNELLTLEVCCKVYTA